jgi:hypothetical protein
MGQVLSNGLFMHFNNNKEQISKGNHGYDLFFKIRPILEAVQNTCIEHYFPGSQLSIDETFQGRLFFKQYMPS